MKLQTILAFALPASSSAATLKSLLSTHPKLSTLHSLLHQFDLLDTFNTLNNITVIAPTDQAYLDLANWGFNLSQVPAPVARALLSYHVLQDVYESQVIGGHAKVVHTNLKPPVLTNVTAGAAVKLSKESNGKIVTESGLGVIGGAEEEDVMFDGGVLHTLNSSMVLPHNITLTAVVSGSTKFLELMGKAGLTEEFEALQDVTLLIPNNAAFKKFGELSDPKLLVDVLKGHVVPNSVLYGEILSDGGFYETLSGKKINVKRNGNGMLGINGTRVVKEDIILYGGVAHEIDEVLVPIPEEKEGREFGGRFSLDQKFQVPLS